MLCLIYEGSSSLKLMVPSRGGHRLTCRPLVLVMGLGDLSADGALGPPPGHSLLQVIMHSIIEIDSLGRCIA